MAKDVALGVGVRTNRPKYIDCALVEVDERIEAPTSPESARLAGAFVRSATGSLSTSDASLL
jgi:hypothetical protein